VLDARTESWLRRVDRHQTVADVEDVTAGVADVVELKIDVGR
jgi:hypothetical protein